MRRLAKTEKPTKTVKMMGREFPMEWAIDSQAQAIDENASWWMSIMTDNENKIFGYATGYHEDDGKTVSVSIDFVEIHPSKKGKGFCSPLMSVTLDQISKHVPKGKKLSVRLQNVAKEAGFYCYSKGASKAGLIAAKENDLKRENMRWER